MFEYITSFIRILFKKLNIICYFRSDCCNKTNVSDPQEQNINIIKIPWRKVITI